MKVFALWVLAIATAATAVAAGPSVVPSDIGEGSRVETTVAPNEVQLTNGVNIRLGTRSAGRIYSDHLFLEGGAVRVGNFDDGFAIRVRELTVEADKPESSVVVRTYPDTVEIASLGGSVRVTDGGARLIRVAAGQRISFKQDAQDQSGNQTTQTGAQPAPPPPPGLSDSDRHALLWFILGTSIAAVTFGSIAASEGKSP